MFIARNPFLVGTSRLRRGLVAVFATALIGSFVLVAPEASAARPGSGSELLPNLKAFPAQDVQVATSNGKTLLRFSTLSGNLNTTAGPALGALELRAGEILTSGKQKVYQRVYLDGHGYRDYLVGDMAYHLEHEHFHFDDYARYELQPANNPGAAKRIGQKTSFCIMDTTRLDSSIGPRHAAYSLCSNRVQGMSQGWGDRYGWQLVGQEIDITGLADGTYRLTIIVDPQGHLHETSTADNRSDVLVTIANGTATVTP
jgi:hypothetical protein